MTPYSDDIFIVKAEDDQDAVEMLIWHSKLSFDRLPCRMGAPTVESLTRKGFIPSRTYYKFPYSVIRKGTNKGIKALLSLSPHILFWGAFIYALLQAFVLTQEY